MISTRKWFDNMTATNGFPKGEWPKVPVGKKYFILDQKAHQMGKSTKFQYIVIEQLQSDRQQCKILFCNKSHQVIWWCWFPQADLVGEFTPKKFSGKSFRIRCDQCSTSRTGMCRIKHEGYVSRINWGVNICGKTI